MAISAITIAVFMAAVFTACEKEEPPVAGFEYAPMEIIQWDEVTFTNTSEKGETYEWDFGDDMTSTEENPVHSFVEAGTYTVELTVKNADGENSISQDLTVAEPENMYTVDGVEYSIDEAFEYESHGGKEWRMLGAAFAGATADPGPAVNLMKFAPNLGTGTLEGTYTVDNSMEAAVGTFTYGFTANYQGMAYDTTTSGNPTGTLTITKFTDSVYEFKLEDGKLIFGDWDFATFTFVPSGYEPSFSVMYRGEIAPLAK